MLAPLERSSFLMRKAMVFGHAIVHLTSDRNCLQIRYIFIKIAVVPTNSSLKQLSHAEFSRLSSLLKTSLNNLSVSTKLDQ